MKWHIPTVLTSDEIINKAFHAAAKIKPANSWERAHPRKVYLKKINAISSSIQSKLSTYIRRFPSVNVIVEQDGPTGEADDDDEYDEWGDDDHGDAGNRIILASYGGEREKGSVEAFYYDIFDISFGIDPMKKSLGALQWAVKRVQKLESEHIKPLKRMVDSGEMEKHQKAFLGRVSSVIKQIGKDLLFLANAREKIRKLPHIDEDALVVVVAGSPNVGKSSLINLISSGNSQIASYPFTTKGIFLGHITIRRRKVVLVDTPGLLDRPEHQRNDIERKASSAIRNLSSAVIFVLDPSESSGTPLTNQESLIAHLGSELGDVPTLIIDNKCDLLKRETRNLQMSCETGEGQEKVMEWLTERAAEMDERDMEDIAVDLPDGI